MVFLMTQNDFLHMRITGELKEMLDHLRKAEPDLPSKAEMVRRLIERASKGKRK